MNHVLKFMAVMVSLLSFALSNAQDSALGEVLNSDKNIVVSDKYTLGEYSSFGAFYLASFDSIDHGFYGLGGVTFGGSTSVESAWGWDYLLAANWGLGGGSDYEGILVRLGPAYGYNLGSETALITSGTFNGVFIDGFHWGLALTPRIAWKTSKEGGSWHIGLDLQWAEGSSKITTGFIVGIAF